MKNRIAESILDINPKLRTTKEKTERHGFGISSVKDIAAKYQGTADFYEDSGWFIAQVTLHPDKVLQSAEPVNNVFQ